MPDKRFPIRDEDIEAEARAMMRDMIKRAGWYSSLSKAAREHPIKQDVDRHRHLMVPDARKRLEQRNA
jgi:chemotaxis regulatin CheY-phosphate phosphatase CheZ